MNVSFQQDLSLQTTQKREKGTATFLVATYNKAMVKAPLCREFLADNKAVVRITSSIVATGAPRYPIRSGLSVQLQRTELVDPWPVDEENQLARLEEPAGQQQLSL